MERDGFDQPASSLTTRMSRRQAGKLLMGGTLGITMVAASSRPAAVPRAKPRSAGRYVTEALQTDYFFSGREYIRVTRGETGPGTIDPGYPAPISNWRWGAFGANGIDAALYSGPKCYFFSGTQYIRVTRGVTGPGTIDPGYPAPISNWHWGAFGANGIDAALNSDGPIWEI